MLQREIGARDRFGASCSSARPVRRGGSFAPLATRGPGGRGLEGEGTRRRSEQRAEDKEEEEFGEIAFWWGVWLFGLAADPSYWWTAVGPLAIALLFQYVSLPSTERRMLERRPDYARRVEGVSASLPRPPRRSRVPAGQ